MGDIPPGTRPQASDNVATGFARDSPHSLLPASSSPYKSQDINVPFYSQLSSLPQQQQQHLRPDFNSSTQPQAHYSMQEQRTSPLNLSSMASALPDYGSNEDASMNSQGPSIVPRSLPGASTSAMVYQPGQNLQTPSHGPGNSTAHAPYNTGYATGLYQNAYIPSQSQYAPQQTFNSGSSRMHPSAPMQQPYQGLAQGPQYMYYANPYAGQPQFSPGYHVPGTQGQASYDRRGSLEYSHNDFGYPGARLAPGGAPGAFYNQTGMPQSGPVSSIPRGPPRKPKQSGHALWVGNLPPGTTVVALKDHFSREATKEIESLFLISKSNCAFVNYRTESSCTAAMHRFHDSRFNGVRLVCRLRRSSAPASGVPTGPSAMVGSQQVAASSPKSPLPEHEVEEVQDKVDESIEPKPDAGDEAPAVSNSPNKFFIVKSLTLQDLELSVRNGIWATQSHNEDVLNKAFRSTENVYLVFSANKSGEYFGYARMASPILEDGSKIVGSAPKAESIVDAPDVPKSIPTPATEWAPRGKIIDDSARGTIFWEAELSESELEDESVERDFTQADTDSSVVAQSWGKPFKIEWISTNRLPFYRTRGLRNPWNANREVKIARDGTELEPNVGERLIQMFHRLGPSNAGAPMMPIHPLGGHGMLPMRPF